jgi:hypothetical protein
MEPYEKIEIEVILFETEDIITTSGEETEGDIQLPDY